MCVLLEAKTAIIVGFSIYTCEQRVKGKFCVGLCKVHIIPITSSLNCDAGAKPSNYRSMINHDMEQD